ncbi:CC0125/CC1285 family lipoprotein [Polynucleobacter sp.]|uniref:CC0125/CC1285 family lipoprotein n=1 Tax=Polynucleobacter sp. TaxID=2029855 RepID=UPI003F698CF7
MKNALILLFILFLCGCSVRYTERVPGIQPGYVDSQLGQDTYQVKIGEAWQKDWADLEKFALYRASEITKSKNRRYFLILNSSTQISTNYLTIPSSTTTNSTASVSGSTAYISSTSTSTPSVTAPISGGWYTLDFRVLANADATGKVVDAQQIIHDYQIFIDSRR